MAQAVETRTESLPPDAFLDQSGTIGFRLRAEDGRIERWVRLRAGGWAVSDLLVLGGFPIPEFESLSSAFDSAWLRATQKPTPGDTRGVLRCVDLFSGVGGMSLGIEEGARALGLEPVFVYAADLDEAAVQVYNGNFRGSTGAVEGLDERLGLDLRAPVSDKERVWAAGIGPVDLLVGGPPCQGHSNLNNHTRRADEKNQLYGLMGRAALLLNPDVVVVENVQGVHHDRAGILQTTRDFLAGELEYKVSVHTLRGGLVGVPQARARVFMVATRRSFSWDALLDRQPKQVRSFMWACEDLQDVKEGDFDQPGRRSPVTQARIDYLFDRDLDNLPNSERPPCHRDKAHTYNAVYGRLRPNEPTPTITTGFQVMGQGRFVHPSRRRTLTPHEGARLQFFPDWFSFGEPRLRKEYGRMIGNAVPSRMLTEVTIEAFR
jgi:DNA (cytosine-5)-methyltransferase 1